MTRALELLRRLVAACFWMQRDMPAAAVLPVIRPAAAAAHRGPSSAELLRRRILYLYHQADEPAREVLWRHGWPAYT